MDISKLAERIKFGVASPPYQSRSAGTDFEDLIKQLKSELKTIETFYTQNAVSSSRDLLVNQNVSSTVALPQLLNMDEAEYFLLNELLMSALKETRLSTPKSSSSLDKEFLESQVGDRFKLNLSKMGKVFKQGV